MKMREAVVQALRKLQELCVASYEDENLRDYCERLIRSALSAPPRQCDVGTPEEQYRRWVHFCEQRLHRCDNCPCNRPEGCTFTYENMPYAEEGGAE